jgi:phospholipase/lecithinase/hemolysin
MTPQGSAATSAEAAVISDFNSQLAAAVAGFKANHSGVSTFLFDAHAAFTVILDDPTKFGFVDNTSYGNTGDFWGYVRGKPSEETRQC